MILEQYGYDEYFKKQFKKNFGEGFQPARVLTEHKSQYIIMTQLGEMPGTLSGKFRYGIDAGTDFPTVGDFAAVNISSEGDRGVIQHILPRKTCFLRRDAWSAGGVQLLCANIDTVFVCMSLNKNYNLSRIERYLVMAKESRAKIAVVLTKADLCRDIEVKTALCEAVCGDTPVFAVSAVTGQGMEKLLPYFAAGQTVAALGSSGVGKSTIVNALFGQAIMNTSETREDDDRGRHTTVHRQIILLPSGGLYLDTPGLRELGLAEAEDAVAQMYEDIEELQRYCRFSDCHHGNEPGCAVREALESGELEPKRWQKYLQYKKEAGYCENKERYIREKTQRFKNIQKTFHKGKGKEKYWK